jgi:hypothetical protein
MAPSLHSSYVLWVGGEKCVSLCKWVMGMVELHAVASKRTRFSGRQGEKDSQRPAGLAARAGTWQQQWQRQASAPPQA